MSGTYPTGRCWDVHAESWKNSYQPLPVVNGKRIILVPKYSVRRTLAIDSSYYYNHHVLNFIQEEHLSANSSLVYTLKNGSRKVYKKDLKDRFPFSKNFLAHFSENHPEVLANYKTCRQRIDATTGTLTHRDFDETYDEKAFAEALSTSLDNIPPGRDSADRYHTFMIGALEVILWPNLILPQKESAIHGGRKRN